MFKIYLILTVLATGTNGAELRQMHIHEAPSMQVCTEKVGVITAKMNEIVGKGSVFAMKYKDATFEVTCLPMVLSLNGYMQ